MTAQRALRLARTCVIIAVITIVSDHDFIFNSLDLITIMFTFAAIGLVTYAKGRD